MFRRGIVAVAAIAFIAAPLAHAAGRAADEVCTPDTVTRSVPNESLLRAVEQIFAPQPQKPESVEVLVARIGADGKPVIGCVSTPEAARRFLTPRATPRRAEDQ